jgi:hypothetical protein
MYTIPKAMKMDSGFIWFDINDDVAVNCTSQYWLIFLTANLIPIYCGQGGSIGKEDCFKQLGWEI